MPGEMVALFPREEALFLLFRGRFRGSGSISKTFPEVWLAPHRPIRDYPLLCILPFLVRLHNVSRRSGSGNGNFSFFPEETFFFPLSSSDFVPSFFFAPRRAWSSFFSCFLFRGPRRLHSLSPHGASSFFSEFRFLLSWCKRSMTRSDRPRSALTFILPFK